jgi:hypothetical protein
VIFHITVFLWRLSEPFHIAFDPGEASTPLLLPAEAASWRGAAWRFAGWFFIACCCIRLVLLGITSIS